MLFCRQRIKGQGHVNTQSAHPNSSIHWWRTYLKVERRAAYRIDHRAVYYAGVWDASVADLWSKNKEPKFHDWKFNSLSLECRRGHERYAVDSLRQTPHCPAFYRHRLIPRVGLGCSSLRSLSDRAVDCTQHRNGYNMKVFILFIAALGSVCSALAFRKSYEG